MTEPVEVARVSSLTLQTKVRGRAELLLEAWGGRHCPADAGLTGTTGAAALLRLCHGAERKRLFLRSVLRTVGTKNGL